MNKGIKAPGYAVQLAIELDGDIHKERKDYDKFRDDFMKSLGIKTLRFDNNEVMEDIEAFISKIKKELVIKA